MIYVVALVEPFAPVVAVWLCMTILRQERREHARERDLLTNQLLNSVGKPWQQAPADERAPEPEVEQRLYAVSPDQYPVN